MFKTLPIYPILKDVFLALNWLISRSGKCPMLKMFFLYLIKSGIFNTNGQYVFMIRRNCTFILFILNFYYCSFAKILKQ